MGVLMKDSEKKPIFMTIKEANLPKDYKILSRIKNGYVLAIRKHFSLIPDDKEKRIDE
jgi:hypothetical protein